MARLARVVTPGCPHHVTQRGNRRCDVFWNPRDRDKYNPVRAGMVARAEDYPPVLPAASAAAHCGRRRDPLLSPAFPPPDWTARIPDWAAWLADENPAETAAIRRNTHTGRPCGTVEFIRKLETLLGRLLLPQKAGRKPKNPKPDSKGEPDAS